MKKAWHTSRERVDDCLAIVREMQENALRGVFHCFSGNMADAEAVMATDFLIGIGGVVTFKNSTLPDVIREIPIEFIVLETDSPYLAPTPYRGKRNESSYLTLVAQKIAEIKELSIEEVAQLTTENAKRLFGRGI